MEDIFLFGEINPTVLRAYSKVRIFWEAWGALWIIL